MPQPMIQKIDRWGNSLGLRLPSRAVQQLSLSEGSSVSVTVEKNSLILRPQKKRCETLEQLLKRITPSNRHGVTDWGKQQGKEVW